MYFANSHLLRKRGCDLYQFENFVKGELEAAAKKAEDAVSTSLNKLPKIANADDFALILATLGFDEEILNRNLREFRDSAQARRDALTNPITPEQMPSAPSASFISDLTIHITELEKKALVFDEDAKKTDKIDIKKKVCELESREWLHNQKKCVEEEIARLKKVKALEDTRRLTNTTALSRKKSELAQELVSDAFIKRFNSELKALSGERIKVELVQHARVKGMFIIKFVLKMQNSVSRLLRY